MPAAPVSNLVEERRPSVAAVAPSELDWRESWSTALTLLVPNRIAVFVVMWIGMAMWTPTEPPGGVTLGDRPNAGNLFLDGWLRWDAHWYWQIARHGYTNLAQNGAQRDTVFFPLYPLAVRLANALLPNTYVAGMVVSNLCLAVAAVLFFRLATRWYGREAAERGLALLLASPWSFCLSAMYSESLFLVLVLAAFTLGERRQWVPAGMCAAAAGATRVLGLSVAVGLVVLYLEQARSERRPVRVDILGIGLAVLGPAAHLAYLGSRFHDPFAFLHNQDVNGWGADRTWSGMWKTITTLSMSMTGGLSLELAALALVGCIWVARTSRWAYGIWGLLYLAGCLRIWDGIGRFVLGVFPLFLWAGVATARRGVFTGVLVASAMLLALLEVLFAHWLYVG